MTLEHSMVALGANIQIHIKSSIHFCINGIIIIIVIETTSNIGRKMKCFGINEPNEVENVLDGPQSIYRWLKINEPQIILHLIIFFSLIVSILIF